MQKISLNINNLLLGLALQKDPVTKKEEPRRTTESTQTNNLQSDKMSIFNKIPGLNLSFGQVEKGKIALDMNMNLAFRDKNGSYVSVEKDDQGNRKQVHVGDLKFDVPFYTVPSTELSENDVVILDGEVLIVQEKPKTGGYKFVNPITGNTTSKIERTNLLGMYFYNKVVSMFNMLSGGQEAQGIGLNGLNPMTLMLLSGEGGLGGSSLVEAMILSQTLGTQNKGGGVPQNLLPLLLMKGNSGGLSEILPLMLMSGNNPFQALTQPAVKQKVAAKVATTVEKAKCSPKKPSKPKK